MQPFDSTQLSVASRPLALACLLLGLVMPSAVEAKESAILVEVRATESLYEAGMKASLVVTNNHSEAIFFATCGALQPEVLDDEAYRSLSPTACEAEGPVIKLDPGVEKGGLLFQLPAGMAGETGRVAFVFGLGCRAERSLSRAGCRSFATVYSSSFRVRRPPSKN